MFHLLKHLFKKTFGEKTYVYLNRMYHAVSPYYIVDRLRYYYIWLKISKGNSIRSTMRIREATMRFFVSEALDKPLGNEHKKSNARKKLHVLFGIDKWCERKPEYGLCNTDHNLCGSLEASGLATQDKFYFDKYPLQHYQSSDTALLSKCIKCEPDILIMLWPSTPQLKTLGLIKEKIKIPVVVIWGDLVNHMEESESFLPFVTLNLVWDSTTVHVGRTSQTEKYMPIWTPQDPRIFYNPGLHRDIDISFVGTMANHPDRLAGISALKANGIDVYQKGGQREIRLPVDEYARVHMRSKIALSFCYHPNFTAQSKGRIFEITLCGSMLMETENSETAKYFEPMVDYVPFTDERDLVEKVRYYLAHDSERMEIAGRGHQKAKERYTGEMFWKTVFQRVFGTNF